MISRNYPNSSRQQSVRQQSVNVSQQRQEIESSIQDLQQRQQETEQQKREIAYRTGQITTQSELRKGGIDSRSVRGQVIQNAEMEIAQIEDYQKSLQESQAGLQQEAKKISEIERARKLALKGIVPIGESKEFRELWRSFKPQTTTTVQNPERFNPVYVNGKLTGYYDILKKQSVPIKNVPMIEKKEGIKIKETPYFLVQQREEITKNLPKIGEKPIYERNLTSLEARRMGEQKVYDTSRGVPTTISSDVSTITRTEEQVKPKVNIKSTWGFYVNSMKGLRDKFIEGSDVSKLDPLKVFGAKSEQFQKPESYYGLIPTNAPAVKKSIGSSAFFLPAEKILVPVAITNIGLRATTQEGKTTSFWVGVGTTAVTLAALYGGFQIGKGITTPTYRTVGLGYIDSLTGKEATQVVPKNWAAKQIYKKQVQFSQMNPPRVELRTESPSILEIQYPNKNVMNIYQSGKYELMQSVKTPTENTFNMLFKSPRKWKYEVTSFNQEFYSAPVNTFGQNPELLTGVVSQGKKGAIFGAGAKRVYTGFVTADKLNLEAPSSILVKETVIGKIKGKEVTGITITRVPKGTGLTAELGITDIGERVGLVDIRGVSGKSFSGYANNVPVKNWVPSRLSQTQLEKMNVILGNKGTLTIDVGNENVLYGLSKKFTVKPTIITPEGLMVSGKNIKFGLSSYSGKAPRVIEITSEKNLGFSSFKGGGAKSSTSLFDSITSKTAPIKNAPITKGQTGNLGWAEVVKRFGVQEKDIGALAPTYVGGGGKGGSLFYGEGMYEQSLMGGALPSNQLASLISPKTIVISEDFIRGYQPSLNVQPVRTEFKYSPFIKTQPRTKEITKEALKNNQLFKTFEESVIKTNIKQGSVMRDFLKTTEVLKTNQLLKTQQSQSIVQTQTQTNIFKSLRTPNQPIPIIPIPVTAEYNPKSSVSLMKRPTFKSKAYQTYVKRFGRWKVLSGYYSRGGAIRLGERFAVGTLGASFKIVPTKREVYGSDFNYVPSGSLFRKYRISRGRRIPLSDEWIQLASKRLSSFGERSEIRKARKRKLNKFRRLRL